MGKPKKSQKTAEELRLQKRDCERRRRARIKENPVLYEAAKKKDRARYVEKKNKKQVKLVAEMTPREHRTKRKEWRERKARCRQNQKRSKKLLQQLRENTLDTTDDETALSVRQESPSLLHLHNVHEEEARPQSSCASDSSAYSGLRSTPQQILSRNSPSSTPSSSRQKNEGVRASRVRRDLKNIIIQKQRAVIEDLKLKIHTLRMKLHRVTQKNTNMVRIAKKKTPLKEVNNTPKPKKLRTSVVKFLERDDNSKLCPGKKDCITKNKIKKQKRYLTDTLQNLHRKFQTEKTLQISFASFCRLKPFWIVKRKLSERDTCLCVIHENIQLMFEKLKYLEIIPYQNLSEVCKAVVCDINSHTCMSRQCKICKDKVPQINEFDDSIETCYKLWTVNTEKRLIKGAEKQIRRTMKTEIKITKKTLLLNFIKALDAFLQHQHNITHQYRATTQLKKNISVGDIFMQVDFAENYCCKYSDEIQAVHFGASRQQISLHTGVYYYKCPDTGELKSKSFCTFSDCLRHDAGGVFAHLQKILDIISYAHSIKTLHILSDGPTAQYRNKKSFYLFSQYVTQRYGLQIATWNFSEAGHGKGPMDGVGAVVKRTADRLVAQGKDIPDFVTFVESVKTNVTNVTIDVVTEKDIESIDQVLTDQGKSITGTLKIHQITWTASNPTRIYLRKLTCIDCRPGQVCSHYSLSKGFTDFISIPSLTNFSQSLDISSPRDENVEKGFSSPKADREAFHETETDENVPPNCKPVKFCLRDGMWVIAKFVTKKTEKHFLGQIIGFDGDEPRVKFMKMNRSTKDHAIFVWIEPEDIFPIPRNDVIAVINEPTPSRRGELLFNNVDLKKFNL